jgi:hypothetical protein
MTHELARGFALTDVANVCASAGNIDEAIQAARSIKEDLARGGSLIQVVSALAKLDRLPEAMQLITSITHDGQRASATRVIVTAHAKAGRIIEALNLVQTITIDASRAHAFCSIAEVARAGKTDDARAMFTRAIDAARSERLLGSVTPAQPWSVAVAQAYALATIGEAQDGAGMKEEAGASFALALRAADLIKYDDPPVSPTDIKAPLATQQRATTLAVIAKAQAAVARGLDAAKTFAIARQAAQSITSDKHYSLQHNALKFIAVTSAEAGFPAEAVRLVMSFRGDDALALALAELIPRLPN